jgi:predicted nucleic acid-binding protein
VSSGFLLDTNVVSELRKKERANANVRRWIGDNAGAEFWLSVLVVGELRRGVELIARRDNEAASTLRGWLDSTVKDYADRILPITIAISERWALLAVPDPVPIVDGLLAATAIEHDLILATRNIGDVRRTGVGVVNPFDPN